MAAVSRRSVMTLFSGPTCIYSHRIRLVLAEKGISVEIVDVEPGAPIPEDLADLNPYGEAPTLVDRDLVLYDTKVIAEYLDERFPHPPLMPVDPVSRAKARLVISRIERDWVQSLDALDELTGKDAEKGRKALAESLVASDEVFGSGLPFFLSEELSMMDCVLAPLLWRLHHYGVEIPASAEHIQAYAKRLFGREAFQKSLSDAERAMQAV
ncbi:Stringent starvation protein A [wastewater metagenome]|uniref:Stringent starvation protein A n=2 Tax=unclassified sequences TaxID=12908 RepID=A0A5B8RBW6_9ZZZZ|nr:MULTISPECIES: glutathione S-transferase N-terminal domain-containing protein [Arhodomonas]MCS4504719.1 glutathione S-transferase N-terminal domain-containing protein [Arhodomonas aquaeolei]QEA04964.1 stringent starvation protein A [uncultured organism]